MANYEATRYDFDGAAITGIQGFSTGTIVPLSDTTAPSGFLECNVQAVSRTAYSALYAIVGTTYGSCNGSTTFNVPDLKNDVPLGISKAKALASTGGANTVAATGNISGSTTSTASFGTYVGDGSQLSGISSGGATEEFVWFIA